MDNTAKDASPINELLAQFEQDTAHLPVAQIISELQIAIERISFTGLHNSNQQALPELDAEIDQLLQGEVSDTILAYIHWLASRGALGVFADQTGRMFLSYCIKLYKDSVEIKFITPIELSSSFREVIAAKLGRMYPPPARVVYEVMPSLVAGFVIQTGTATVDKSLRSFMANAIKTRLASSWRMDQAQ